MPADDSEIAVAGGLEGVPLRIAASVDMGPTHARGDFCGLERKARISRASAGARHVAGAAAAIHAAVEAIAQAMQDATPFAQADLLGAKRFAVVDLGQ